jgi:3-oxoacyl-[acyl-carrier protein] reductase
MSKGNERLVLITGAARGIGAATAALLASDGYCVVASDIDEPGLEKCAATIWDAGGLIETSIMDVSVTASVNSVVAAMELRHQRAFDVVINNAGFATYADLESITDDHWEEVLNLNLMSMMRVSRAVAPAMRKVGQGMIICLGSYAGHVTGWPGHIAYAAAKAGVTGLVRSLAMELAPSGLTVNGIAPAGLHASADQVPLGYVGTSSDIANAISLLANARARFMTGQMLCVDGGMSVAI